MDGSTVAKESAEDVPSLQYETSQKECTLTAAVVDVELTEILSISDRALLRRFGQMESSQKSIGRY